MSNDRILVIDDEKNILRMIEISLSAQGFKPEVFSNPAEGLKRAQERYFDIAFIDLKMQPIDGIQVLAELKKISPDTTVVIMTAFSSVETAVEAIKKGAYDYITKPFNHKEFSHIVDRVYKYHSLSKEVNGLRLQLESFKKSEDIVTKNYKMRDLISTALHIAQSDISVLIEGESGTGKELFARFIHENSERRNSPFIAINCAAIPENLFESELFGHSKGSFTGAIKDRIGRFEMADQGTVFLDEVAELPKAMQVKLLRFLQSMEFERVGESSTRKIDVRIISATNREISKDIESGDLREDFFYRISGVRLTLPPLRERAEDIPALVMHFLKKFSPNSEFTILPEALKALTDYNWPGNIREFENVIKRVTVLARDKVFSPEYLPQELTHHKQKQFVNVMPNLEELERSHIVEVVRLTSNPKDAARILGISETTLWRKRKQFGI